MLSYTDLIREVWEAVVTIKNLEQAMAALMAYVPSSPKLMPKDTTLDRIRPLMQLLGNPQDRLKIVHIAGTSGKTSTAYYMAALLVAANQKVGLTVSPHVDSITERVQINGQPMPETAFCDELGIFLEILQRAEQKPSYFELLYAFTLWVLARQNIDYAVAETGVGGLHDATNVAARPDKVCIITDIGFDHMHLLGKTLPEIAAQKIGIVHDQNHVFMYQQADEIMSVVKQWTSRHKAPLQIIDEATERQTNDGDLNAMPAYQQRNWLLAHGVYEYIKQRDNLPNLARQALRKTQAIEIPGRMDIRHIDDKTIIMDGAHNAQKMTTFIDSFKRLYPETEPVILLALKNGKEYEELVPLLTNLTNHIIITTFKTSQDFWLASLNPKLLAQAFRAGGIHSVKSIADQHKAFQALIAAPEKTCIITGSFYLLSQIRNNEHLV